MAFSSTVRSIINRLLPLWVLALGFAFTAGASFVRLFDYIHIGAWRSVDAAGMLYMGLVTFGLAITMQLAILRQTQLKTPSAGDIQSRCFSDLTEQLSALKTFVRSTGFDDEKVIAQLRDSENAACKNIALGALRVQYDFGPTGLSASGLFAARGWLDAMKYPSTFPADPPEFPYHDACSFPVTRATSDPDVDSDLRASIDDFLASLSEDPLRPDEHLTPALAPKKA